MNVMLDVDNLSVQFHRRGRTISAVSDVSFKVRSGTTLALVGESGSGKSTTAKAIVGLLAPSSGSVTIDGRSSRDMQRDKSMRRSVQMIFQHPAQSLDPLWSMHRLLVEAIKGRHDSAVHDRMTEVMSDVGLDPAILGRHNSRGLSGGQAQRVAIARALLADPSLIVLDEPTASLDSTVRLRILRLLTRLQNEHDLTYVLITHDLRSAQSVSDRVAVMLNGRIVEIGSTQAVLERPIHPYTRALLDAAPTLDPRMRESTMSAWTRQLHMAPTSASQVRPLREIGIDHHAAVD